VPQSPTPITAETKGPIERLLSLFAPVKAGEAVSALLLALNVFLLLASYYVLKTVREPLILTQGGAEVKSYAAAGQALLLLLVLPLYSGFSARVNRIRLITWVTVFFISHLAIFYVLGLAGVRIGVAFFLWVGIFNGLIVAQFWAFANDIYDEDQGKRLFPIVGVGASLGAWVGAESAEDLFSRFDPVSAPYQMMLVAAGGLAVCIGISRLINKRETLRPAGQKDAKAEQALSKEGGFKLILSSRYLLLIAILVFVLNTVNTTGEFILGKVVVADALAQTGGGPAMGAAIGRFYGDFFGWVNLLGFLFQLFLVSRIFKYIGVRGTLFILPCIALGSYSLLVAIPILSVIRVAKILENSTDYSINNTARRALFLPTSREAKYKAQAVMETLVWRAGDMMQAAIVFVGAELLGFGVRQFGVINVVLVFLWLVVVVLIYREHKKLTGEEKEELQQAA
jgi:ATP:ADP antiporter, AAA family